MATPAIGSLIIDAGIPGHPYKGRFLINLHRGDWVPGTYEHEIRAQGGFWTAKFEMVGQPYELENLMRIFLGSRMHAYAPNGVRVWEGYVNATEYRYNGVLYSTSLDDMANNVNVRYTTAYTNMVTGPTVQIQDSQSYARSLLFGDPNSAYSVAYNDNESQNLYGVKQRTLVAGESDSGASNLLAQRYLAISKMPRTRAIQMESSSQRKNTVSLTVYCKGYFQMLDWRQYNYSSGGTGFSEVVIAHILSTVGFEAARSSVIAPANFTVQRNFGGDRSAMVIIQELAKLGASNGTRVNVGIYEEQRFISEFATTPTRQNVQLWVGADRVFRTASGRRLYPSEVRPNAWLTMSDQHIVGSRTIDIDRSTGFSYVESVRYTEPDQVSIGASDGAFLDVLLSQTTLQGIR